MVCAHSSVGLERVPDKDEVRSSNLRARIIVYASRPALLRRGSFALIPPPKRIRGWGRSSIGRALALQARGWRFDPARLHIKVLSLQRVATRLFSFRSTHLPASLYLRKALTLARFSGRLICRLRSSAHHLTATQYKYSCPRRKSSLSASAGDASNCSSSRLVARTSNLSACLITTVTPLRPTR